MYNHLLLSAASTLALCSYCSPGLCLDLPSSVHTPLQLVLHNVVIYHIPAQNPPRWFPTLRSVKPNSFLSAFKTQPVLALGSLSVVISSLSSSSPVQASLLLLRYAEHTPASGPLSLPVYLPGMLFLRCICSFLPHIIQFFTQMSSEFL